MLHEHLGWLAAGLWLLIVVLVFLPPRFDPAIWLKEFTMRRKRRQD